MIPATAKLRIARSGNLGKFDRGVEGGVPPSMLA
jgi:hypothetical protein